MHLDLVAKGTSARMLEQMSGLAAHGEKTIKTVKGFSQCVYLHFARVPICECSWKQKCLLNDLMVRWRMEH